MVFFLCRLEVASEKPTGGSSQLSEYFFTRSKLLNDFLERTQDIFEKSCKMRLMWDLFSFLSFFRETILGMLFVSLLNRDRKRPSPPLPLSSSYLTSQKKGASPPVGQHKQKVPRQRQHILSSGGKERRWRNKSSLLPPPSTDLPPPPRPPLYPMSGSP